MGSSSVPEMISGSSPTSTSTPPLTSFGLGSLPSTVMNSAFLGSVIRSLVLIAPPFVQRAKNDLSASESLYAKNREPRSMRLPAKGAGSHHLPPGSFMADAGFAALSGKNTGDGDHAPSAPSMALRAASEATAWSSAASIGRTNQDRQPSEARSSITAGSLD